MLEAAIFDLDGVLIDSHPVHQRAWLRFLETVNRFPTPEELEFVLDGRKREDILRHFLGKLTDDEVQEYGHLKESLFREEAAELSLVPGAEQFMTELEELGVRLGIASSGSSSRVNFILDRLAIRRRFCAVVTGDDVREGKPNPEIFLRTAGRMSSAPTNTVVIEDAVAGVRGATLAAMKCVAIATNGRSEALAKAGADLIVPDFHHINTTTLLKLFGQRAIAAQLPAQ